MANKQHPVFVYGTLLNGESAHGLIAPCIERIVPATMSNAELYNLGAYPMLTAGSGIVRGEVCWLAPDTYVRTLQTLDRYEGPQYTRELLPICVNGADETQDAWVFQGKEAPAQAELILAGDWRNR